MAASWRHPDMKWRLLDEDVLRGLRKMLHGVAESISQTHVIGNTAASANALSACIDNMSCRDKLSWKVWFAACRALSTLFPWSIRR